MKDKEALIIRLINEALILDQTSFLVILSFLLYLLLLI